MPQTEADAFIFEQVRPMLAAGETVIACAYLAPVVGGSGAISIFVQAATRMAAFGVLTDQRLLLIQTRIGAFKPLLENHGVESLDRRNVRGVHFAPRLPRLGPTFRIELADGRMLHYANNASKRDVSTQAEFFRQLPQAFGASEAAAQLSRNDVLLHWGGLAVGVAVATAYVWFRLH